MSVGVKITLITACGVTIVGGVFYAMYRRNKLLQETSNISPVRFINAEKISEALKSRDWSSTWNSNTLSKML